MGLWVLVRVGQGFAKINMHSETIQIQSVKTCSGSPGIKPERVIFLKKQQMQCFSNLISLKWCNGMFTKVLIIYHSCWILIF